MEAQNHPAYIEEQAHLDDTINTLEEEKNKSLKPPEVEMYAPPDTIRIFSNEAARRVKDIKAALRYLYFGRVDWKPEGGEKADHFYIGISPLYPYILAWQDTLASELYYNQQTKRESGELLLVRTYRIEDRTLLEIEDNFSDPSVSGELDPDSMLARILEESRGILHEIVATINAQQNRIIRAPLSDSLVVQGVPGSGKTVIALHRVAFLLYNHKELRTQNILILGPNPLFMQYVAQVLPSLGERQIPQKTFDHWVIDQLGEKLSYQSQEDLLEFWLSPEKPNVEKIMHLRNCRNMGSPRMGELLVRYVDLLRNEILEGKSALVCRYQVSRLATRSASISVERSVAQIRAAFEDVKDQPFNQQREALERKLSNEIAAEIARQAGLTSQERDAEWQRMLERVKEQVHDYFGDWRALNVSVAYRRLFRQPDLLHRLGAGLFSPWDLELMSIDAPTALTPFRFSDLVGLLYFKLLLEGTGNESYGHIVVDEAQDIPALFFEGLSRFTPKKSVTVLGDIGQGIFLNNGLENWDELRPIFPTLKSDVEELRVCYRSTFPIMTYANSMLNRAGVDEKGLIIPLNRPGQAVMPHPCDSDDERAQAVIEAIQSEQSNGRKTIAVICKSASECQHLADLMQKAGFTDFISALNRNSSYRDGVVMLPAYLAKGLEFDAAIVADSHNYACDDLSVRLLFVAITRAAHSLHVCWLGIQSPLLDDSIERVEVSPFLVGREASSLQTLEEYAQVNRLDADWCVEQLARSGRLGLLKNGMIDPVVLDLLIQSGRAAPKPSSEEIFIAPLDSQVEESLRLQVRRWEGQSDPAVQAGLALAQTTFGLLKNHLRSLALIPPKEVEFDLPQQVILLVRLHKLLQEANLTLPAGRWSGRQRLNEDIDRLRLSQQREILQTLLDYGILETQTLANQREQVRISARWIREMLELGLGFSPGGLDNDLLERLPRLPQALDWMALQEVAHD